MGYAQFKIDKAPKANILMAESPIAINPAIIVQSYWTVTSIEPAGNYRFYTSAFSLRKSRLNWDLPISFKVTPLPSNFWKLTQKFSLFPLYTPPGSG